jgi:hypothetical protein
MARNRIIYGSQSVWCNGMVLYRVQTLGSTTTFTSEDIFELGAMDIIDVVDDVPAVAVTLNTNDFGDPKTMAILAQVAELKLAMNATASGTNANLVVVSGTGLTPTDTYLHGACLADFAIVCGNLPGVSIWAPVQSECDLGTLANNIDQTLFMDEVFVNSLEFGYTTGANATENYGAETDNKTWLLNDGRFVNWEEIVGSGGGFEGGNGNSVTLEETAVVLTDGEPGFLRTDSNGARAVTVYDASANNGKGEMKNYWVDADTSEKDDKFVFKAAGDVLYSPSNLPLLSDDKVFVLYASDAYADTAGNSYFDAITGDERVTGIGAIRQGQVEIYIVSSTDASYTNAWRLTGCTITSDLTREPLAELGRLGPYDRPLTVPIPITVTIDTTAGDLEHWARFADRYNVGSKKFSDDSMPDIDLADLMAEEDLKLVVKIFYQTDEEAGGTGDNRKVLANTDLGGTGAGDGAWYFEDGEYKQYTGGPTEGEHALKTIIVEHLKMTDEAYTIDMGTNATQTFGFRSTNDLYVVKGDLSIGNITGVKKVRRNS